MVSCEIQCARCGGNFEAWGGGTNLCIPCTKIMVVPDCWPRALREAEAAAALLPFPKEEGHV
jgi:hypothetical protein